MILPVTILIWFTLWIRFGYDFDTSPASPRTGFDVFARFLMVFGLAAELLSEPSVLSRIAVLKS